ncbi:MAG: GNAT family N-acetyltransferase [Clostridiales bacterium]|nr:GNAT family N-acetyltransferase [Clostridiales bacterium]
MEIQLIKAGMSDCADIHRMQAAAFEALLDKYQDFDTSPGAEPVKKIEQRMAQENCTYYLVCLNDVKIGAVRVVKINEDTFRISQMFILPEYQGKGYAQQAIALAESFHPQAKHWTLDTIKQEAKLCHLYEKMGYRPTGTQKHIKDGMDLLDYAK